MKKTYRITAILLLAFFTLLMVRLTLPYASMRGNVAFLRVKQGAYTLGYWRASFYIHVFTSCFVLLAGFTQFTPWLLGPRSRIHRAMGWIYLVIVVGISGPAAFLMALYANGGLAGRASFLLLATLWIAFTAYAGYYATRRRFLLHGTFMFRSYALTLSAITLRAYTYLFGLLAVHASTRDIYITTAWLGWVPNLILAEILIHKGWVEKVYRPATKEIKAELV